MKPTKVSSCPICGQTSNKHIAQIKDYSVSREVFTLVECEKCDLLFTNPKPIMSDLWRYYESPEYISHTNQKNGLFGRLYQMIRSYAIKKKYKSISEIVPKGKILDYGSGTGEFLNYFKKNGWDTKGVEIADTPREMSIAQYGVDVIPPNQLDQLESQSFDVITMWHVLEHLYELKEETSSIINKLRSGGLFVVAVPNPESWDASHYGSFWAAWDMPIHLYHFKKKNIIALAKTIKCEVVEIKKMNLDAFYIALMSEKHRTGKKRWFAAVFYGLKSNYLGRKQNTSSLTYVLRKL